MFVVLLPNVFHTNDMFALSEKSAEKKTKTGRLPIAHYKQKPADSDLWPVNRCIPTNDALGLAFTDLINSFGVKQNVTGPTHHFNHTLDLIISHGIDLTDIDIIPQSDDVTDHFLVSCMLHITDINYMAPRYRSGRIIIPATKDRFTNNLPDLSQLLCVPINTDELDNY